MDVHVIMILLNYINVAVISFSVSPYFVLYIFSEYLLGIKRLKNTPFSALRTSAINFQPEDKITSRGVELSVTYKTTPKVNVA